MAVTDVPANHPRAKSLLMRERLAEGLHTGVVTETGLIAHGRGEAFDYLLGERTHDFAKNAIDVASAMMLLAEHPVVSINGNVAALAFEELILLERDVPELTFEVNLFHYSPERAKRAVRFLAGKGMRNVLDSSEGQPVILPGVASTRRWMHPDGLAKADVVLVGLEDGDRCEALAASGRTVIVIDLNPLSRSAQTAHVTIVDEVTRALAVLDEQFKRDRAVPAPTLRERIAGWKQQENLAQSLAAIRNGTSPS